MKKLFLFSLLVTAMILTACGNKSTQSEEQMQESNYYEDDFDYGCWEESYVDLGLPSGTLWSEENEDCGLISYEEAMSLYGNNLPTKKQWDELTEKCTLSWEECGMLAIGPNGNSIILPVTGFCTCDGYIDMNTYSYGYYWSSTPNGAGYAWGLAFGANGGDMYGNPICGGQAIRLVH